MAVGASEFRFCKRASATVKFSQLDPPHRYFHSKCLPAGDSVVGLTYAPWISIHGRKKKKLSHEELRWRRFTTCI